MGVCIMEGANGEIKFKTLYFKSSLYHTGGAKTFDFKVKDGSMIYITSYERSVTSELTKMAIIVNSSTWVYAFVTGSDGGLFRRGYKINSNGYLECTAGSSSDVYTDSCVPKQIDLVTI